MGRRVRTCWLLLAVVSVCFYIVQVGVGPSRVYAHEAGEETPEQEAAEQREAYTPPADRALLPEEKRFCRKNTKLVRVLMARQIDRSTKEYKLLTDMNDQLFAYQASAGIVSVEADMLSARIKKQQQLTKGMINTLKTVPTFECKGGKIKTQIADYTDNLENVVVAIRAYAAQTKDYVKTLQQANVAVRKEAQ